MDVGGCSNSKQSTPLTILRDLEILPGDFYVLHKNSWHEVKHRDDEPSVSVSVKYGWSEDRMTCTSNYSHDVFHEKIRKTKELLS
jgi:hypothetical protein